MLNEAQSTRTVWDVDDWDVRRTETPSAKERETNYLSMAANWCRKEDKGANDGNTNKYGYGEDARGAEDAGDTKDKYGDM